jgi:periplasmic copper chaperone A
MRYFVTWTLTLLAIAAGSYGGAGTPASPQVEVRDAWIRLLPGSVPGGGYLTLVNTGDLGRSLTGASSDDYGSVSLHQSVSQGGVSSMHPVDVIVLKPHSTLVFGDSGYHLMLMNARKPLKPGDTVTITLQFADGSRIPCPFQLRSPDMLMSK